MAKSKVQVQDDRRTYIGGTDLAAIMRMSRWKSELTVYLEKKADAPPAFEPNERMEFGLMAEQLVADLWMKRTGKKATKRGVLTTLRHKDYPYIACHPDRSVVGENALLECKTAEIMKLREWKNTTDENGEEVENIPAEYILQCHQQMLVTGCDRVYIACAIGFGNFVTKVIERDEKILKNILDKQVSWWTTHIVGNKMPENLLAMDSDNLDLLYPTAKPDTVITYDDDSVRLAMERYLEDMREYKKLELQLEAQKNEFKMLIKDNDAIHVSIDKERFYYGTWKNQKFQGIDKELEKKDPMAFVTMEAAKTTLKEIAIKYPNIGRKFTLKLQEVKK